MVTGSCSFNQPPFLAIPTKRASPLPELPNQLLSYISTHFRDTHPEAFKNDVNALVGMRKEWVEPKNEAHPEIVRGLMRLVSSHFPVQAL
jgi:programmed cell death 6-interacting protein